MALVNPQLKELDRALSRAGSNAEKAAKLQEYLESMASEQGPLINLSSAGNNTLDPHQAKMRDHTAQLMGLVQRHNLREAMTEIVMRGIQSPNQPRIAPLKHLLCANQNVSKMSFCEKKGSRFCSSCTLVAYCSPECQKVGKRLLPICPTNLT